MTREASLELLPRQDHILGEMNLAPITPCKKRRGYELILSFSPWTPFPKV